MLLEIIAAPFLPFPFLCESTHQRDSIDENGLLKNVLSF